jgi:primosomal protein N'
MNAKLSFQLKRCTSADPPAGAHPDGGALTKGDRDGFLAQAMAIRRAAGLPPCGRLAALVVSGRDGAETERLARLTPARA